MVTFWDEKQTELMQQCICWVGEDVFNFLSALKLPSNGEQHNKSLNRKHESVGQNDRRHQSNGHRCSHRNKHSRSPKLNPFKNVSGDPV